MSPENCPACGRELSEIQDFPRIQIKSVELLPIPEKILHWSSARAASLAQLKDKDLPDEFKGARVVKPSPQEEIDLTEEIKKVVNSEPVQKYLDGLGQKVGFDVETYEVTPPFLKGRFSWAFAIPHSNYFLSLRNEEGKENIATLTLWGHGPNLGSAGGPTLQAYADLAKIKFQGKLLPATAPVQ